MYRYQEALDDREENGVRQRQRRERKRVVTPCEQFGVRCSPPLIRCCLYCTMSIILSVGALYFALSRNYNCYPAALENLAVPYGGELFPKHVILKERRNAWGVQFTKLIDVYDATNNSHIGYFYDMNFLAFMRFGFSDASNRIWFEAKRPWFYGARTFPEWYNRGLKYGSEHLYLERCDDGVIGRLGGIYHIDEDISRRPWWCKEACMKILDIARQDDWNAPKVPMANVHFNYTLEWYYGGFKTRQAWNMVATDGNTNVPIARAHQSFALQNSAWAGAGQMYLSRWHIDILVDEPLLPHWVLVFMAALDDIDESDADTH